MFMALMASNNSILQQPQNQTDFRLTRSNHEDKEADPASDWCLPLYKGRDVLGHPQHDSDQSAVESSWMVNHRTKGYCKDESGVSSVPYHLLWDFLVTTNPHAADRPRMAYRNSGHVMPTSVNFHKHIYRCCKCRGGSRRDRVPIYRRLMLSMVPSEHVLPVPIVYGPAGTRIALGDQRELISSTSPTPRLPYLRFLAGPHNPPPDMLILHPSSACDICLEGYSASNPPHAITCGHIFCLRYCIDFLSPPLSICN